MIRIHRRPREEGRGARLVLQIHDELLLEVPETETSAVRELVREEMVWDRRQAERRETITEVGAEHRHRDRRGPPPET
jgi:hypothetical protein